MKVRSKRLFKICIQNGKRHSDTSPSSADRMAYNQALNPRLEREERKREERGQRGRVQRRWEEGWGARFSREILSSRKTGAAEVVGGTPVKLQHPGISETHSTMASFYPQPSFSLQPKLPVTTHKHRAPTDTSLAFILTYEQQPRIPRFRGKPATWKRAGES